VSWGVSLVPPASGVLPGRRPGWFEQCEALMDAQSARRRHEDRLMALPHVTGVGTQRDDRTGEEFIVVLVTHKMPAAELREQDLVPQELDGIRVRVMEVGEISAQDAF
jgi:hypothetical protein